jgi:hypothetical protein
MLVVGLVAFLAAALTLFSGFGLGTLLLPVFALFFPLETAVAATAVVHLANNLFKGVLLGRHARLDVVLRFGVPALLAAVAGALLLEALASAEPLASWRLAGVERQITAAGLAIGALVVAFAVLEMRPAGRALGFDARWMPVGGLLSGFLGGVSGHQGALRTAFLIRLGLSKEAFLATGIVCSILVDVARLATYAWLARGPRLDALAGEASLVAVGVASAFAGSFLATRLLPRIEMRSIHLLVGVLLALLGLALAAGLV